MIDPALLAAIRAVHARIPATGNMPGGWMESYRQDVGALLADIDRRDRECGRVWFVPDGSPDRVCRLPRGHAPQPRGCEGEPPEDGEADDDGARAAE